MNNNFFNLESIKEAGFEGFKTVQSLFEDRKEIPKQRGVYLVLRLQDLPGKYLELGTGGFFKGKDPNVSIVDLESNWVYGGKVLYIGKAGSLDGKATLYTRLTQYLKFGMGRNIGHWGGRLIWQLGDVADLIICWKPLPNDDPRMVEKALIKSFTSQFGKRPFANLVD